MSEVERIKEVSSVNGQFVEAEKLKKKLLESAHLLTVIQTQTEAMLQQTRTAGGSLGSSLGSKAGLGDPSPAGNYWPSPDGDQGGIAGDPSVPQDASDAYQKLVKLFLAYSGSEDNAAGGQVLIVYLIRLEKAGFLNGPDKAEFEKLLGTSDIDHLISSLVQENWELSFFEGGVDQATKFIQGLTLEVGYPPKGQIGGLVDQAIYNVVGQSGKFITEHTDAQGRRFYKSPYTGETYYWSGSFDPLGDTGVIYSMVLGEDRSWDKGFDLQTFLQAAHSGVFDLLAKKCGGNAAELIALFMGSYDMMYQEQIDAYANTINRLSSYTNDYMNKIMNFFQQCGSFKTDKEDMEKVFKGVRFLMQAADIFHAQHVSNPGFFKNFDQNTYQQIMNMELKPGDGFKDGTILDYMRQYESGNKDALKALVDGLNNLNPPPDEKNPSQPNPEFQALTNALSQGSSLITGQSKSVGTLANEMTNQDQQLLKVMADTVDPKGSGLMALVQAIVKNQISN